MDARTDAGDREMKNPARKGGDLQVTTPSDREIAMTRAFDAPRRLVFDA